MGDERAMVSNWARREKPKPTLYPAPYKSSDWGCEKESQRDSASKPRVARNELPWVPSARAHQLQRSCAMQPNNAMPQGSGRGEQRRNPVGVGVVLRMWTQGSSFLAAGL